MMPLRPTNFWSGNDDAVVYIFSFLSPPEILSMRMVSEQPYNYTSSPHSIYVNDDRHANGY